MSFIDMGSEYDEVSESKPIPAGLHELTVKSVNVANDDAGALKGLKLLLEATDVNAEELGYEPAPIMHYISIPQPDQDNEADRQKGNKEGTTTRMKQLMFKRFAAAFKLEMNGSTFDPNDIVGLSTRIGVEHDMYQGNVLAKIKLPPLQD